MEQAVRNPDKVVALNVQKQQHASKQQIGKNHHNRQNFHQAAKHQNIDLNPVPPHARPSQIVVDPMVLHGTSRRVSNNVSAPLSTTPNYLRVSSSQEPNVVDAWSMGFDANWSIGIAALALPVGYYSAKYNDPFLFVSVVGGIIALRYMFKNSKSTVPASSTDSKPPPLKQQYVSPLKHATTTIRGEL